MPEQGSKEIPLPPPLPPFPSKESPSPFLEKLASAPPDYLTNIPATISEPETYKSIHYFFYGTLCRPAILASVLDRKETPQMRPAQIIGYELSSWGQYRTLVDGPPGQIVEGFASLIMSPEEEYKLAYYETSAYSLAACRITFTDGKQPADIGGMTFKYAGDARALQEGRFDRALWQSQMNVRLPHNWGKTRFDEASG